MDEMENKVQEESVQEEIKEKPYTLRPLCDEDLWPILGIIAESIPDDLSKAFVAIMSGEKNVKQIGYDVGFKLVVAIIKNVPKLDHTVYGLLSELSGISADEIRKMPFGTTPKMIMDVYKDVKNSDFFEEFSKSF